MQIDRDFFAHLLACLAQQKGLHERLLNERVKAQAVIDAAWSRGMALLQEDLDATAPVPDSAAPEQLHG